MISFDLRCGADHVFEVWFRSSSDYENQRERRLIACPQCGDSAVTKAVMAPNVAAKGNRAALAPAVKTDAPAAETLPAVAAAPAPVTNAFAALPAPVQQMIAAVAAAQAESLPRSRWVGDRFAAEARAAHEKAEAEGTTPDLIHGQATRDEAEALADDGIAVLPLLVPFVPPESRN